MANKEEITLRPAEAGQADEAARLVYETDPRLWDCFFEGDARRFLAFFARQWREEESMYGHSNATVALRKGKVVGLEAGYDRDTQDRVIPGTVRLAREILTPGAFRRYAEIGGHVRYLLPPIPKDAYYVLFLATDPDSRGQGIGARLLVHAFERALQRGCRACHLDVASDTPAVGFYRRLGMEILSESRVLPLEEQGVASHFRMVRRLG